MDIERWLPVVGYESSYEVSNIGRVKRIGKGRGSKNGRILKSTERSGYPMVALWSGNKRVLVTVHRLVALAFLGQPRHGFEVNHKDNIRSHNNVENLEWITHSANVSHVYANGYRQRPPHTIHKGMENGTAKLTDEQVIDIRRRRSNGELGISLAREYGVSNTTICRIILRKNWRHL